jgi:hypothetical protein
MKYKLIVAVVLSLFSIPSFAAHAVCYDAGRVIYNQDVVTKELNFFDGFYTFVEKASKKLVLTNAVCVVDLKMPQKKSKRKGVTARH